MMTELIVAGLPVLGTAIGSLGGILISNRLINYRLAQLEAKVDKHNGLMEKTYRLEEQMMTANRRIDDLEDIT